jgi:hypothetical protein
MNFDDYYTHDTNAKHKCKAGSTMSLANGEQVFFRDDLVSFSKHVSCVVFSL